MADVKSLSVKDITKAAHRSAEHALKAQKAVRLPPGTTIGFVPPYWWIGLILREEAQLEKIAEAQKLAAEIHAGIAAELPGVKAAKPGVIIENRHIIMGFLPPRDIEVFGE